MAKILPLIFSAILFFSSFAVHAESTSSSLKLDPQISLNSYIGLVKDHVNGILRTARVIAVSPEARSGRWEPVRPMLERFSQDLATDATIWFALPDGSYFSTETGGLTDKNLKDRTYFPELMDGKDVEGHLVISKSTGHRSIIVATPVKEKGRIIAAIGISVRASLLSKLVDANMKLPDNAYFYALTPDTKIALHRYSDRMFKNVADIGDEKLGSAFASIMNRDHGIFDYELDGRNITSIFRKSDALGWYFFIAREKR
ncbi:MAG: cache domain-containing protein [Chlorobium sp.]|uniref:cache domain-containing protein n=1 Tax=Chlorobium sp. TaxID=1095 RepID=UPI0025C34A7E|nr:cache domain-containing protein [Chlorobium sp.]MCF8215466.1 cache domain-containing protein [Chlorobium sp.]MCF8270309.1 cache domain-containing protein [Chlorobium sp.]MCF8286673.1 cache domain-containing protein [Chlorobium sp.]MCF8290366.1 cache domain-containing protein [Chlorobium sp.]MCF8384249.1 cache domain-containing protein [Chlorobium sp.]